MTLHEQPHADAKAKEKRELDYQLFLQRQAEIDVLLARLQDLGNEHFGVRPEDITSADLATVEDVAAKLREVVTLLCGEDLPLEA
jgi:hypothetical protein